ncbi:MAG: AMMECR1 domain-containing protein, partial [Thermodesulfobacteriota bacterium]
MKTGNCIIFLAGLFFLCMPYIALALEQNFPDADKEFLIRLARNTLTQYLKDGSKLKIEEKKVSKSLREKGACFVTLTKKGTGLRGCIGIFERNLPLYQNVIDRAISAAVHDSRFPKVRYEE